MVISLIAALGNNKVIGIKNTLPWRMPADMRYFKELTAHKPIIMGKNTYDSIGRPLPNRLNIVLSREPENIPGCVIAHSVEEAIVAAGKSEEIMVIGGASVYKQFMPVAGRLYLTFINHDFEGDAYFPDFDLKDWRELTRADFKADVENPYDYSFVILEKL